MKVTREEVDDKIDEWNEDDGIKEPIHVFLGWTSLEYSKFVESGEIPNRHLGKCSSSFPYWFETQAKEIKQKEGESDEEFKERFLEISFNSGFFKGQSIMMI